MAVEVLGDVLAWRLKNESWDVIARGLEDMKLALAAGDSVGLRRAVADVEMAGPHRIVGLEESAMLPLPERHRERVNELIHSLDASPQEDSRTASDADAASPGASG